MAVHFIKDLTEWLNLYCYISSKRFLVKLSQKNVSLENILRISVVTKVLKN